MTDLSKLQSLIKKDKEAYKEEFLLQQRQFVSELELLKLRSSQISGNKNDKNISIIETNIGERATFLSNVARFYPKEVKDLPLQMVNILEEVGGLLSRQLRLQLVKGLMLMRNRGLLRSPMILLPLFFQLFRIPDKQLRSVMYQHIIQDLKKTNQKKKDQKLNRTLQNFLGNILQEATAEAGKTNVRARKLKNSNSSGSSNSSNGSSSSKNTASYHAIVVRKALQILIEMYRKRIWTNDKTVNIISTACFSTDSKTLVSAVQFFLSSTEIMDDDDDDEYGGHRDEAGKIMNVLHHHSKMTRKRKRRIQRALDYKKKQQKKEKYLQPNWPAIQLIYDPQTYSEKLFGFLKKSNERFEVRILIMNLLSKLITSEQLMLNNFYPYIQRYLQPHQQNVTTLLAITAQSCHSLSDPDVLQPLVKSIANNFISDGSSNEAMTVGLNTVREICLRCPYAIDETLLQDLALYKNYKDKGVSMASRALISLFREVDPSLLKKKDRGRPNNNDSVTKFGEVKVADNIDGIQLLEQQLMEEAEQYGYNDGNVSDYDDDDDEIIDNNEEEEEDNSLNNNNNEDEEQQENQDKEGDEDDDEDEDDSTNNKLNSRKKSIPPKKPTLDSTKILTDEDFEQIEMLKILNEERLSGRKRSRYDFDEDLFIADEEVDEANIVSFIKRRKMNKEERMNSIYEGREGREKFGSRKNKKVKTASTSNREKIKNKPYMLMKQSKSVREKRRRTAREKMKIRKKHAKQSKNRY